MFGRESRSPGILNSTKEEGPDTSIVADITEEVVVERTAEVQKLHKKVMVKEKKTCFSNGSTSREMSLRSCSHQS